MRELITETVQAQNVGGGASAFTDLTDAPANYTGAALQGIRVNAGETGLEFYTPASGGGVERQFIYRPSEVTPADNVYNDLSLLLTDAQAVNGKKLILVDILANQAVPAGTYNFANCTLIYMNEISKVVQHELQFAASTFFSQLPDAIGVALKFANTGLFYVHTTSQTETNLHIIDHGKIDKTAGASFIRANTAGHIVNIFLTGTNATIANTEGITGTIRIQSGSTGNLFVTSLNTDVETRNNIFGANGTVNIYQLNGKQRTGSDTALTTPPTIIVSEFASRFTKLVDAPTSYTGQSLKALRVNAGETGIEFYTPQKIFYFDSTGPQVNNQYNNFADLMAAVSATFGSKTIEFLNLTGSETITGTNSVDFTGVTLTARRDFDLVISNCTLAGVPKKVDRVSLRLDMVNGGAYTTVGYTKMDITNGGLFRTNTQYPAIIVTPTNGLVVELSKRGRISNNEDPTIHMTGACLVMIMLYATAVVDTSSIDNDNVLATLSVTDMRHPGSPALDFTPFNGALNVTDNRLS